MASLDNFHTHNPAPHPTHRRGRNLYPYHLQDRFDRVRLSLVNSATDDVVGRVPLAPVQPVWDPTLATGRAAPDPTYVERVSADLNGHFVPTRPRTHLRESGDTAEHKLLIQGTACWRARLANWWHGGGGQRGVTRINTFSRYHPYLGR